MCSSKVIHPLDSFAQFSINRFGDEWIDKCWCSDNELNPWEISPHKNNPKVHIKCKNVDYHDFWITPSNYSSNVYGCPYCGNGIVHHKTHARDSLGAKYPKIISVWSAKNQKSPFDYAFKSHKKVWLECENKRHEDYLKIISDYTANNSTKCPKCVAQEKESNLQRKVREYISQIGYSCLHENQCNCKPINLKTKMPLPFDNEIPELKLIIEVHGIQHYELSGWHIARAGNIGISPDDEFVYQKWKDKYKKDFALACGYDYLEIPYTSEQEGLYKQLINNKIQEILNRESVETAGLL